MKDSVVIDGAAGELSCRLTQLDVSDHQLLGEVARLRQHSSVRMHDHTVAVAL
ncbi:uncharacterized protein METZ01_LOCUS439682, partial [marine metagenome]